MRHTVVTAAFLSFAAAFGQNPAATVSVDANANLRPINPNIYGVAYGSATTLPDLTCVLNRYGGNNTSRYNWQANGDNRGQDWYFESIGDSSSVAGERGDTFFSMSKGAGAQAMLTIPMIGWVAKLGSGRGKLASFSIAKYGAQTGNDWQWYSDAGNGVLSSNGQNVINNPADANTLTDSTYQQSWVQHLFGTWGAASSGGVKYYILDNEHSIWQGTHRDVHPTGATMSEIRDKMLDYASKIKAVDPSAQVVGPEEWGWSGYFYSGYDQQYGGLHGRTTAAGITCPGCSINSRPAARSRSTYSASTIIRKAANSATMFPRRWNCGATVRRARCGTPTISTRPGSTTRCN